MTIKIDQPESEEPLVKSLWYCKTCRKETPHEIRRGSGVIARLCIPCMESTLNYELDRD